MTVNPGFGGQSFITSQLKKNENNRKMIDKIGKTIDLEVDGGIKGTNVKLVVNAGANVIVAGSYIYNSSNNKQAIDSLKNQ